MDTEAILKPSAAPAGVPKSTAANFAGLELTDGMRTLKQDGIEKVLQGLTTIEQVRAVSN